MENRLQFPRQARLIREGEFRAVFRDRGRARAGFLQARFRANGLEQGRLGLAISRRAAGSAVARNRIRRQARESFRLHQRRLAGLDVVVSLFLPRGRAARNIAPLLPRLWDAVTEAAQASGKWKG